jgi:hypothetical protein
MISPRILRAALAVLVLASSALAATTPRRTRHRPASKTSHGIPGGAGDPLASVRRLAGKTTVESTGALETLMLLAQLASQKAEVPAVENAAVAALAREDVAEGPAPSPAPIAPPPTPFQLLARDKFAAYATHAAVVETADLLRHGFGYRELARFAACVNSAPYFVLTESEDLWQLAELLPSSDTSFNVDRLYGYAQLVKEFYWDARVGTFLRESLDTYRQVIRRPLPSDVPAGATVLVSPLAPLAPGDRLEFARRSPRPAAYLVLGG